MPRIRKPTLDDVAAEAGVARVTVSRVLQGGPNVREAVREKVLRAVAKLDYRVNEQASQLARGRSRTLALVFASDLAAEPNSFWEAGLELGALRACTQLGYQLMTQRVVDDGRSRDRVLKLAGAERCDAVILTPPHSDDVALLRALARQDQVVACIAPGLDEGRAFASVGIDDARAGYDLARYLLGLGHARFAFLGGIAGHVAAAHRLEGVRRALDEAGLGANLVVVHGNFTFQSGAELAPPLLGLAQGPTALICANDDMAVGALLAAHRQGVSVPEQVSITGFDNTPVSAVVWPPLTTVRQPITEMGARAVELVVEQLTRPTQPRAAGFQLLQHELVVRMSAAAPARRARGRKP